ncbi:MAG: hypothetical protein R6W85_10280 [Gillisia sp.]
MGQLKFEKKFSEKLREREIAPKSSSWEALSVRLDSEEKRRNPIFWWIGIAATIIGGVLIFGSFFNEPLPNSPEIVNVPVEKQEQGENKIQQKTSEEAKQEAIAFEGMEEIIKPPAREKPLKGSEAQKPLISDTKSTVAAVAKKSNVLDPIPEPEIIETKVPEIRQSVPNAMAEVGMPGSKGNITDAEIDALLAEAGSQLNQNRVSKAFSEKITANALLWDVEMEMEASFREKVFEVVKDGYLKARTAVANRNNSF